MDGKKKKKKKNQSKSCQKWSGPIGLENDSYAPWGGGGGVPKQLGEEWANGPQNDDISLLFKPKSLCFVWLLLPYPHEYIPNQIQLIFILKLLTLNYLGLCFKSVTFKLVIIQISLVLQVTKRSNQYKGYYCNFDIVKLYFEILKIVAIKLDR